MKFNEKYRKFNEKYMELYFNDFRYSFISALLVGLFIMTLSIILFDVSTKFAFLLEGVVWVLYFNISYVILNKNNKKNYYLLLFLNSFLCFTTYFLVR